MSVRYFNKRPYPYGIPLGNFWRTPWTWIKVLMAYTNLVNWREKKWTPEPEQTHDVSLTSIPEPIEGATQDCRGLWLRLKVGTNQVTDLLLGCSNGPHNYLLGIFELWDKSNNKLMFQLIIWNCIVHRIVRVFKTTGKNDMVSIRLIACGKYN